MGEETGPRDDGLHELNRRFQQHETRDAVRNLKENLAEFKELMILQAGLTRVKYDALLRHGFTPEQAMELCKKII